jgi:hypothetical protein
MFFLKEQILNKAKSDVPGRNSKSNNLQNRKAEYRAKVNLNKVQFVGTITLPT